MNLVKNPHTSSRNTVSFHDIPFYKWKQYPRKKISAFKSFCVGSFHTYNIMKHSFLKFWRNLPLKKTLLSSEYRLINFLILCIQTLKYIPGRSYICYSWKYYILLYWSLALKYTPYELIMNDNTEKWQWKNKHFKINWCKV